METSTGFWFQCVLGDIAKVQLKQNLLRAQVISVQEYQEYDPVSQDSAVDEKKLNSDSCYI